MKSTGLQTFVALIVLTSAIACDSKKPPAVFEPKAPSFNLGPASRITLLDGNLPQSYAVYPRNTIHWVTKAYDSQNQRIVDPFFGMVSSNSTLVGVSQSTAPGAGGYTDSFMDLTLNQPGHVTITLSSPYFGPTVSDTVGITFYGPHHASISPTGTSSLNAGQTLQFASSLFASNNVNITNNYVLSGMRTWLSSNPSVATVSSGGLVSALNCGQTTITSRFFDQYGDVSSTATVSVPPPAGRACAASIDLQDTPVRNIYVGGGGATAQTALTFEVRDASNNLCGACANAVSFVSSNPAVVSVTAGGILTAQGLGTATITGTIDGRSDQATVQITAPPVITIDGPLVVRPNSQCTFIASISGGQLPYGSYHWYDDETTVADNTLSVNFTLDYAPSLNFLMRDADGKLVTKHLAFTYDVNAAADARCTY